jgi:hypothetical protein
MGLQVNDPWRRALERPAMLCGGLAVAALLLATAGCARRVDAGPRVDLKEAKKVRETLLAAKTEGAGPAAAGTAAATGTGWATLKGTFTLVGPAPAPRKLNVNKDEGVCTKGNQGLLDDSLVVDSGGGIANVVVYAKCKRVHESAAAGALAGKEAEFDQKNCMFKSHVLGVQVGQHLVIKNSDPIGHNTNIAPSKGASFNQTIAADGSAAWPVQTEESFPAPVSCNIHPWMRAYLLPRKDLYFAVTKPDGSFEIANLPAGEEIELQLWHERGAGSQGALVLKEPADLHCSDKGRCKLTLKADETKTFDVKVPLSALR